MKNWKVYTISALAPLTLAACATDELSRSQTNLAAQSEEAQDIRSNEIEQVNDLVSIYIDAAELYHEASDVTDNDPVVAETLEALAMERAAQRDNLQARIIELGGKPDEVGQALGTGHRAFTQLRTIVDNDSEVAIEEVLRAEHFVAGEIEEVLAEQITAQTRAMLTALKSDSQTTIAALEKLDRDV
ncbi:MAG: PA2169 family four-helix-bundle protein [Hyphomonadaceae bacterium]|nr:PA2169 family four-helix-bundle protein [Hyphomonadaceae bacterium]